MAYSTRLLSHEFNNEVMNGKELGVLAPNPFRPMLKDTSSKWVLSAFSAEVRDPKRMKWTPSIPESISSNITHVNSLEIRSSGGDTSIMSRSNSMSSLHSFPRLQFRDHILAYTQRYMAAEAIEEATEAMINAKESYNEGDENESVDGVRLVQLLVACSEAVACRDKSHASILLSELRSHALVFGSSFQRVASCFVQGLADRLARVQPLGTMAGPVEPTMNIMDFAPEKMEEAYRLVYEICPHIQFGHFVANSLILEAFEGENCVHVVDLGMTLGLLHGHQWRQLIDSLVSRADQPLYHLRITAIGICIDKFRIIGDELKTYAYSFGISLEFSVVESNLENLKKEDIKVHEKEVLVINGILQLHCVVKESRGALNSVLKMIHGLSPKVLVLVEQDSSHNGPFFLGRFMEALHYYSAIFDSLDVMLPKYDTRRAKIEQFYFAEEIKNIVSCEGPERVERHEKVDQWRRRMSRAGFQATPIKNMAQAKQWLGKLEVCEGYTIVEEKGCLVFGWNLKPIVAVSCWKC